MPESPDERAEFMELLVECEGFARGRVTRTGRDRFDELWRRAETSGVQEGSVEHGRVLAVKAKFAPAAPLGLDAPYPLPEAWAGAWMVRALRDGVLGTVRGRIVCADAMMKPELWSE